MESKKLFKGNVQFEFFYIICVFLRKNQEQNKKSDDMIIAYSFSFLLFMLRIHSTVPVNSSFFFILSSAQLRIGNAFHCLYVLLFEQSYRYVGTGILFLQTVNRTQMNTSNIKLYNCTFEGKNKIQSINFIQKQNYTKFYRSVPVQYLRITYHTLCVYVRRERKQVRYGTGSP